MSDSTKTFEGKKMKRYMAGQKKGFVYRFVHNPKAMTGFVFVVLEILLVIFLPLIQGLDATTVYLDAAGKSPSESGHILGLTDAYQDVYSLLIYGGRISLLVGIGSTAVGLLIGIPIGLIAGYFGGVVDSVLMRITEIFISFPSMVLLLVMVAIFGSNVWVMVLVVGFLGFPSTAKLIESNVRAVVKQEYIQAARALGKSDFSIIFRDVLPNVIGPVLVTVPFRVSAGIMSESSMAFLGFGLDASWGKSINYALSRYVMQYEIWIWLPAAIALMLTVIMINLLGEGIRDAFDPKLKL